MSRWIDADELGASVIKNTVFDKGDVIKLIEDAPSIDIVRCGECKYWESDGGALMLCDIHKDPTVPEHFCSYGEREGE